MTPKPVPTSGRFKVTSSIVVTMNLGFNSVPKEGTFTVPLKYIDITRSTHTDLDVMQDKRIADYWSVDTKRHVSDSWKGFTKSTRWREKPHKGKMWSGRRLTKDQTNTRPDHVWPEVWTQIGQAAQNRTKHECKNDKPKLDNARRLRGIYIGLVDEERGENWKSLWTRPCRAKRRFWLQETGSGAECISQGSKDSMWLNSGISWIHKATSAGKGLTSMTHYNVVHKFILLPKEMNIPDAKAAVDKEMEEARDYPINATGEGQEWKGGVSRGTKRQT